MTTFEELDKLPSQELHDRAWHHAKHHLNIRFFWELLEMVPAGEASGGNLDEADADVAHPSAAVNNALKDDPELIDSMRPIYIDYLLKHPDA